MSTEAYGPKKITKRTALATLAIGATGTAVFGTNLHYSSSEAGPVTRAVRDLGSASRALNTTKDVPVPFSESEHNRFGSMIVKVDPNVGRAIVELSEAEGRLKSRGLNNQADRTAGIRESLATEGASAEALPDIGSVIEDVAQKADKLNSRSYRLRTLTGISVFGTIFAPIGTLWFDPWTDREVHKSHKRRLARRHR